MSSTSPQRSQAKTNAGPATIGVQVNEHALELPVGSSLADALEALQIAPASVATALNGGFVARVARQGTALRDGDQVTCFQAIVGG